MLLDVIEKMEAKFEEIRIETGNNKFLNYSYFFEPTLRKFLFSDANLFSVELKEKHIYYITEIYGNSFYQYFRSVPVEKQEIGVNSNHENDEESFDFLRIKVNKIKLKIENESPGEEIDTYLKLKTPEEYDCFNFWKENQKNFGGLGKMAVEFLTSPATSVDSERCFSRSGEVISKKRNRMNPKTCRNLMCLNSWLNI